MPGNVSEPSDGHADVPGWRLQRGSAGGEKTLLFPSRQTLHVLLPDRLLSRQGTEHHHAISDLFFLWVWWCQVYIENLRSIQRSSNSILCRSLGRHNPLRYYGDGKTLDWFPTLSFIVFNAGTGQRHSDGKAEQLAGPVYRCHRNARQRPDDDRGAAHHCPHHTSTLPLPVTAQCGMRMTITFTCLEYGLQTSVPVACWFGVDRSCGADALIPYTHI